MATHWGPEESKSILTSFINDSEDLPKETFEDTDESTQEYELLQAAAQGKIFKTEYYFFLISFLTHLFLFLFLSLLLLFFPSRCIGRYLLLFTKCCLQERYEFIICLYNGSCSKHGQA